MEVVAESSQSRRAAARGRTERRAQRQHPGVMAGPAYITRNIPTYDVLGEEALLKIETTADRILAEIGIEFRDDPASLEHWKRAGADVRADSFQSEIVQLLPEFLRLAAVFVIAGKLDALESHLRDLCERSIEVLRAVAAHRVKLDADRDFLACGAGEGKRVQAGGSGCEGGVFEELAAGYVCHAWSVLGLRMSWAAK